MPQVHRADRRTSGPVSRTLGRNPHKAGQKSEVKRYENYLWTTHQPRSPAPVGVAPYPRPMEEESDMDPIVTPGLIKAAESTGAETGKLMSRVLGPAADEIGEWLRRQTEFRLNNTDRIARKALAKAGDRDGQVPPRVAHKILEDGSYCDDELMAEYLSGVLAGSRTPDGRDDRGVSWAALISDMSSFQLRLHFLLYREWAIALRDRPDVDLGLKPSAATIHLEQASLIELIADDGSEVPRAEAFLHAITALERTDLVQHVAYGRKGDIGQSDSKYHHVVIAQPTFAGVELFGWAMGHAGWGPADLRLYDESLLEEEIARPPLVDFPKMPALAVESEG